MDETTERPTASLRRFLILLSAAAIVFLLYGYILWISFDHDWRESGVFGDSFGGLNAFFSGSALAGVIFSILLQREELRLQREELKLTRIELQRTAAAQENSERALHQQAEMLRLTAHLESVNSLIGFHTSRIDEIRRVPGSHSQSVFKESRNKLEDLAREQERLLERVRMAEQGNGNA